MGNYGSNKKNHKKITFKSKNKKSLFISTACYVCCTSYLYRAHLKQNWTDSSDSPVFIRAIEIKLFYLLSCTRKTTTIMYSIVLKNNIQNHVNTWYGHVKCMCITYEGESAIEGTTRPTSFSIEDLIFFFYKFTNQFMLNPKNSSAEIWHIWSRSGDQLPNFRNSNHVRIETLWIKVGQSAKTNLMSLYSTLDPKSQVMDTKREEQRSWAKHHLGRTKYQTDSPRTICHVHTLHVPGMYVVFSWFWTPE